MIEQGAVFDPGSSASVSDRKSSGKVNLNRADVKELMTLTGIGQSRQRRSYVTGKKLAALRESKM